MARRATRPVAPLIAEEPVATRRSMDLWDVGTFDEELRAFLENHARLVHKYHAEGKRIFEAYETGDRSGSLYPRPDNPHRPDFAILKEDVAAYMRSRTVRAFHYTRLTDAEVAAMRRHGFHLSSPTAHRARLEGLVAGGLLSADDAERLVAASPFQGQLAIRTDRLWFVSHPFPATDGGVTALLGHWGGEVTYMWLQDRALLDRVRAIGRPRIVEAAVPLASTTDGWKASEAVLATFARSLGCDVLEHPIDICVRTALPQDAVLAVHTEGDDAFGTMGNGYPAGYAREV